MGLPADLSGCNEECQEEAQGRIGLRAALAVVAASLLPSCVIVAALSRIGFGLEVFGVVASKDMNWYGNIVVFGWAVWCCIMFIFDARSSPIIGRIFFFGICIAAMCAAAILKGMRYPWAAMLLIGITQVGGYAEVRATTLCSVSRRSFYTTVSAASGVSGLLVLGGWVGWMIATDNLWCETTKSALIEDSDDVYENIYPKQALDYDVHCGPFRNETWLSEMFNEKQLPKVNAACSKAGTIWFLVWVCPCCAAVVNLLVSLFAAFYARDRLTRDPKRIPRVLQTAFLTLTLLITGMYTAVYLAGASHSLSSSCMALFASVTTALFVWLFMEMPMDAILECAKTSPLGNIMQKLFKSDIARALAIGMVNVLIPIFLLLDMARHHVRIWRGTVKDPKDTYTNAGRILMDSLIAWDLSNILLKVNLIGEVCFVLIIGMKATFIFFSWLNEVLIPVPFGIVLVLVCVVGFSMFLLPPVPGSAVYMFAGIVIGGKAQSEPMGFWPGTGVAIGLSFLTKLAACVGQYVIGYFAGQSVNVQSMIGVDTVPTRAIEFILKQSGLSIGKVAILVGGPDWPTSVTCGILKLNVPQMLLGTLPVLVASVAPQVLMGALISKKDGDRTTELLSTVATGVSAACQMGASCAAALVITRTVERRGEELAAPRPEHEAVQQLRRSQEAMNAAYRHVTHWPRLPKVQKLMILMATACQLSGGFLFAVDMSVLDKICFRPFAISSRISDPFEEGGLRGNAILVVLAPMGWVAILLFVFAFMLHYVYVKEMKSLAKVLLLPEFEDECRQARVDQPPPQKVADESAGTTPSSQSVMVTAAAVPSRQSSEEPGWRRIDVVAAPPAETVYQPEDSAHVSRSVELVAPSPAATVSEPALWPASLVHSLAPAATGSPSAGRAYSLAAAIIDDLTPQPATPRDSAAGELGGIYLAPATNSPQLGIYPVIPTTPPQLIWPRQL